MYTFKGFAHIGALIDNELTAVAPVGELAPIGLTYAREKTYHSSAEVPKITLIGFNSQQDGTRVKPADTLANDTLAVLGWIYDEAVSGSFTSDIGGFQQVFLNRWGNELILNESGVMVQDDNLWVPGFIDIEFNNPAYGDNRVKVWLAGDLFLSQYDEFEIFVIPPITTLDNFFNDYRVVKTYEANLDFTELLERARLEANNYPYTAIRADKFDWVDRNDRSLMLSFPWTTIVYGIAGDNVDNIKAAIVNYVLSHSGHGRDDWALIFPDIFTATEFIIVPMWNTYAVPNKVLNTGIYSPVTDIGDALAAAKATCKGTGYTEAHIEAVAAIVANTYKQINLVVVGGPENRGGINHFKDQFPDYTALSSTHVDFGRMDPVTREFILLLSDMLKIAEELTPTSTVPLRFTRMARDGVYYLVRSYEKVQYLVVSKYSLSGDEQDFDDALVDSEGTDLSDVEGTTLTS